ncbi:MAG: AAA family ATPase [Nitriliruptorales bacterium]|nr:AAA family ATPase [Nitriliruptorales bacterium]
MSRPGRPQGLEAVEDFDVCGDLPTGVTLLEASAGTGKTFAIASLAARFVAAGTSLHELLLVTFTRMATGELRNRVRERLVTAEQGLGRFLAGGGLAPDDDVLALLAEGSEEEVGLRRRRLATALSDFDAATISTIHGFCGHVLTGLGIAGDVERDVTFVENLDDLVEEVVDDLYVLRFHNVQSVPPFTRSVALAVARRAVHNPDAVVEPSDADAASDVAMKVRLARAVCSEVDRRKRRAGVITYSDLLTRLQQTLSDPARRAAACARLRERYSVALVDEFQDTDQTQWRIFRSVFDAEHSQLVLIGDPKQAIYAFRGADVYAYLEAKDVAAVHKTLGVNWRSDQRLIDAYDAVFGDATLGHQGIRYRKVRAADGHTSPGLVGTRVDAALRLRVVPRDEDVVPLTPTGFTSRPKAREFVARDVAADLVRLLSSDARVIIRDPSGAEQGHERIQPGHIAVLVYANKDAALVRDELEEVGVPAVIGGAGSVFGTEAATAWLRLLEALERPTVPSRARAVALTPFFGWSAAEVAAAGEPQWEALHALLHHWAGVLARRGVASLQETVTLQQAMPGRLLAYDGGERELTDLRHVGELLHAAAVADKLGATALTTWLRRRIAEVEKDVDSEDRTRRLESDADAVQVLTIHRSKGLEFEIVYCPFLWVPSWIRDDDPPVFHDPANDDRRTIDLRGKDGPGWEPYVREERGQELRLAYVALTRAKHQAVVWWAGEHKGGEAPLTRLLFGRGEDGAIADVAPVPDPDEVDARLTELAATAPGCISVEEATGGEGMRWEPPARPPASLVAARFDRPLDQAWRRTSYSGLTSHIHEARVASEPEERRVVDEPPGAAGAVVSGAGDDGLAHLREVPSLLGDMPAGAAQGTFVHRVLESVDFSSASLDDELGAAVAAQLRLSPVDVGVGAELAAGLRAAIATPLGPVADGRALGSFGLGDRVDELAFEFPLVGGDVPTGAATLGGVASVLRRHVGHADPLAGYADRLDDPDLAATLRGYLSGSIDLTLQVGAGADARFAIVDYKTNWLGFDGEPLSAWHYRPSALAAAMMREHYPLQALLYSVALHRYLRWRMPGYSIERNFAGVLYLFVRGMSGPSTPQVDGGRCGVFGWRPAAALITDLSDLLDVGEPS